MDENNTKDPQVYEISYLIAPVIPDEKIPEEAEKLRKIATDAGASIISDELPHREKLAYSMRKKTVSGSYDKYDEAYFGWVKFEVGSDKIEAIKKAFEKQPAILRLLLISTVKENTFLGKRASTIAAELDEKAETEDKPANKKEVVAAPATIEEMDKSIEDMVKEVI